MLLREDMDGTSTNLNLSTDICDFLLPFKMTGKGQRAEQGMGKWATGEIF